MIGNSVRPKKFSDCNQMELDNLPVDWNTRTLGEIGQCLLGLTYEPQNTDLDGLLVLRSSNVGEGTLQFVDNVYVNMKVPKRILVCKDDLLICVRNGSRALIGKCALIDHRAIGMTFGAFMSVFRSPNNRFVFYCFQSEIVKRQIQEHLGATINQITNQSLGSFRIPFPTEKERDAITMALSDVDKLLLMLEALIAKKRSIKQATMQQLLIGHTRLHGFSGMWETRLLGDIAHIKTGSRNNQDKVDDGKYPFFVRSTKVERINSFTYEGEAILVPGEGDIGGVFHYINGRFDVHQRVYKISRFSSEVCGKFIYYSMVLNFEVYATQNTVKATVDSLRLPAFKNFPLSLPSEVSEQRTIAAILSDMDDEITALEHRRNKILAIKQGMIQQLLTGRVRLVESERAANA